MEAVPAPAHLALPGSLKAKQVCHLYAQLSLGQSCHRQKKVLHLCTQGHCGRVRRLATLQTVACQASQSGRWALQARILEPIGQYWLPYPSGALYFLLPYREGAAGLEGLLLTGWTFDRGACEVRPLGNLSRSSLRNGTEVVSCHPQGSTAGVVYYANDTQSWYLAVAATYVLPESETASRCNPAASDRSL